MTAPARAMLRSLKRSTRLAVRMMSTPWCSVDRMVRDLGALGVRTGDCLVVHSSLSSLGFVPGGPEAVIEALRRAIGPSGTLVMPVHTWDRSGSGDFRFDMARTPSCVGAISERFRRLPGVVRSLHPTHSVAALGPLAAQLVAGHEHASTPCGHGTPYEKLIDAGARVLFLGATLEQNTLFHTFEAFARLPYLLRATDETFTVTDASGTVRAMAFRRHERGPARRFGAMNGLLEQSGALRVGAVGASRCLLVESRPMKDALMGALRQEPDCLLASWQPGASMHDEQKCSA